jgi:hypothetical protein
MLVSATTYVQVVLDPELPGSHRIYINPKPKLKLQTNFAIRETLPQHRNHGCTHRQACAHGAPVQA